MAEAFYGVPEDMKTEVSKRLKADMLDVVKQFESQMIRKIH